MKISDYPRPKRGIGIHGGANNNYPWGEESSAYPWWFSECDAIGVDVIKFLTGSGPNPSALGPCIEALNRGFLPIVRP